MFTPCEQSINPSFYGNYPVFDSFCLLVLHQKGAAANKNLIKSAG